MTGFVRDFWRVVRAPCRGQAELLSRRMDVPLDAGEALGLRTHLLICAGCRRWARQLDRMRRMSVRLREALVEEAARGADGVTMPADARQRVIQMVGAIDQRN